MKILYLADAKDVHTYKWIKYFADKGNDIHVASFEWSEDLENLDNVNLHLLKKNHFMKNNILDKTILHITQSIHIGATIFDPFFVLRQVKKLIKEINPDILHGHSIIHHTIIGAIAGFHPFVVTPWGNDVLIYPKESKFVKYAVKFALNNSDLITCDGENIKYAIIKMGAECEKIKMISHGIDTKKFNQSQKDIYILNEFGIFHSPTILSTRRLGPIHDVGTLINAIPLVLEEMPDSKFIIVGEGEQKEHLICLAKSLNIFDSVKFVGWIPNDKLPKYLASVDVYVSTSISDGGLAISTAEAMASGLPVILTDFGDNGKWIKDGINGFVFPVKDSKTLARKIIYLLENLSLRIKFGEINRKMIDEQCNHYVEMENMENIYKELIERYKK